MATISDDANKRVHVQPFFGISSVFVDCVLIIQHMARRIDDGVVDMPPVIDVPNELTTCVPFFGNRAHNFYLNIDKHFVLLGIDQSMGSLIGQLCRNLA
jgi:hypothetical protein